MIHNIFYNSKSAKVDSINFTSISFDMLPSVAPEKFMDAYLNAIFNFFNIPIYYKNK